MDRPSPERRLLEMAIDLHQFLFGRLGDLMIFKAVAALTKLFRLGHRLGFNYNVADSCEIGTGSQINIFK